MLAGVTAIGSLAVALILGGSTWQPPEPGIPDAGPAVGWGLPYLRLLTTSLGILTVGMLLSAAVLMPTGRSGTLSQLGRADVVRAAKLAAAWAVSAAATLVFTLADILALPLSDVLTPSVFSTYAWDVATCRALALVTIMALIIAVGCTFTASVTASAAWLALACVALAAPTLAGHAGSLGDHALALTSGVAHIVAVGVWVGGLIALTVHLLRRDRQLSLAAKAFGRIAVWVFVAVGIAGAANAYARLAAFSDLWTSGYGRLVVAKLLLLFALLGCAALARKRVLPGLDGDHAVAAFVRLAAIEILLMAAAVASGVALTTTAPTRPSVELPTYAEQQLGFLFPPAPTFANVVGGWRFEPFFFTLGIALAALYIAGYVRLRRRGDAWPFGRLVMWLLGVSCLIWATNAGIATYAMLTPSMHMIEHMALSMFAAMFLAMAMPITLALRAIHPAPEGRRGPREWLLVLIHSPFTRVISHPAVVLGLYVTGLFGLYFTGIFPLLMGNHIGHVLMTLHFLAIGYLFAWVVMDVDPSPRRIPAWGRIMLLLATIAIHSFFAIALMQSETALGASWYTIVRPPWLVDLLADSELAGQIAWGLGEIPTLAMIIVVAVGWSRSDAREAKRLDRKADRDGDADLRAYNEQLAALSSRDSRARTGE